MKLTQNQIDFIRQNEQEDVRKLALKLDNKKYRGLDAECIIKQVSGRQTAKTKLPSWYANNDIVYPAHLSMEQASSEIAAKYKVSIMKDGHKTFVDLTGGVGADFSFLSQCAERAIYVEQNIELCEIARHNFNELGLQNVEIENSASEYFLEKMLPVDVIYLDPSRRNDVGRKVFRIEDCSPNVAYIKNLLLEKAKRIIIKYSPMLDISLALRELRTVSEVHIVSVEDECKELLFVLSKTECDCVYCAVNLNKNNEITKFCFTIEEEQDAEIFFAKTIGKYLYEPNASILKAGAFKSVAKQFGVQKLHGNSHIYTSDKQISDFPGREFEVQSCFAPNKKNLKSFLSKTKKANISVRNFPMSVAQIRQKTGLKEGGEVYVFATTLSDEQKVWVVCEKI